MAQRAINEPTFRKPKRGRDRDARIRQLAFDQYVRSEDIDFDDVPKISESGPDGDNGAYVAAWVWVDFAGTELDKDPDDEA
jgi:hypothetical protein